MDHRKIVTRVFPRRYGCSCGSRWYPCPDAISATVTAPSVPDSLRGDHTPPPGWPADWSDATHDFTGQPRRTSDTRA